MDEDTRQRREPYLQLIESQEIISGRYTDIERISPAGGDGFFSLVFKGKDLNSKKNRDVVLKFFDPNHSGNPYRLQCFQRESDILLQLKGQRNILPLIQEKTDLQISAGGIPFIFHFYVSNMAQSNVHDYIYSRSKSYLKNMIIFREVCKSIQRIHFNNICHRDLKPGNFFTFKHNYACLGDFGTAKCLSDPASSIRETYRSPVGDLRYVAPELLAGLYFHDQLNYCADIFSLGAFLFELFTSNILGQVIFSEVDRMDLIASFNLVSRTNRFEVFNGMIEDFAQSKPLPGVLLYDDSMPGNLAFHIDRLYKSLAELNYNKRENNFKRIFLRVNACIIIIRNAIKREQKKKFKLFRKG